MKTLWFHGKKWAFQILFGLVLFTMTLVNSQAVNSLYFKNMDIDIQVNETGYVEITTTIEADFADNPMHGIRVFLPKTFHMDNLKLDEVDASKTYYYPVKSIENLCDHPLTIDRDLDIDTLYFGDENDTVTGIQHYQYRYGYQLSDLGFKSGQLFYFNILGDGWEVLIQNLTFKVHFPKAFDQPLSIYSGEKGQDGNSLVDFQFDGQTLTGHSKKEMLPYQAVTLSTVFKPGYFTFPKPVDLTPAGLSSMALVGLLSLFLYRKNREKPLVTVEVKAPAGLNPPEVGSIYSHEVHVKYLMSLFVQWAQDHALTIEEQEDGSFIFTKVQDLNPESHKDYEVKLFDALFSKEETVHSDNLPDAFYNRMRTAKMEISGRFLPSLKKPYATFFSFLVLALFLAAYVFMAWTLVRNYIQVPTQQVLWVVLSPIWPIVNLVLFSLLSKKPRLQALVLGFTLLPGLALWKYLNLSPLLCIGISLLTGMIPFYLSKQNFWNQEGLKYLGRILGFRNFILKAEKDRLEAMVHDNPKYFFDVLPYAYVLGVSDVWMKKFEHIPLPQPDWYRGDQPFNSWYFYRNLSLLHHQTLQNYNQQTAIKFNSHGGGSFTSGSGGGGFSGGGFGGGGGGGW